MFNMLVVEDDKNLKKLMTTYLKKNEYNVFEASNGNQALDILDTNYIDLIISDIMMPEMDGYELVKSLRESKYEIPILLVTAKSSFALFALFKSTFTLNIISSILIGFTM